MMALVTVGITVAAVPAVMMLMAVLAGCETAEVAGTEGAEVVDFILLALVSCLSLALGPPPVTAGEDILDAFVGRQLARLSRP